MNRILGVALAVGLAALSGCSTTRYSAEALRTPINAPYQLASGDRLRVIVFGQDNLSNSFSVDGAGNIAMPLIGLVHAQGLTSAELARSIEAKLRQGFLREPSVSVEVEAYRPFFVLGEVTTAGQYPFVNGMTVQNAVAVAGGFTPRGAQNSVDLTRIIDGRTITASVPVTFPVRPGDTIQVRERFF
ncbi:MAG: polysaccharide export protein [Hyphomicrobiales bacterium]|nr:polysaccharide export protein [Hyphomicrobiales bacterium]MBV8662722.1 polysaccharide export protein [Hyphomicrobiales bacterium]